MQLTITRDEEPEALFYVVVENAEENPVNIETGFAGRGDFNRRMVFPHKNRNQYQFNAMQLPHYFAPTIIENLLLSTSK